MDGFGNHDPGSGRYAQQKSPWDELHPGREWANRLRPCANTREVLIERVKDFLISEPNLERGNAALPYLSLR